MSGCVMGNSKQHELRHEMFVFLNINEISIAITFIMFIYIYVVWDFDISFL